MSDVATSASSEPVLIPEPKKPWQSKTVWTSVALALLAFVPGAQPIIAAHPELVGIAVGGIFSFLRVVSHGKVGL